MYQIYTNWNKLQWSLGSTSNINFLKISEIFVMREHAEKAAFCWFICWFKLMFFISTYLPFVLLDQYLFINSIY